MSKLIRYSVMLDSGYDDDLPLLEIAKLMDSLLIKSNVALYFSGAIVPNTESVLSEYVKKTKTKILKEKGREKANFIVIFKSIKSNMDLLKLMKQHGIDLFYFCTDRYEDYEIVYDFFKVKPDTRIVYKFYDLIPFKISVHFDIDRSIDISFSSKRFSKKETLELLNNWLKSIIIDGFSIKELKN